MTVCKHPSTMLQTPHTKVKSFSRGRFEKVARGEETKSPEDREIGDGSHYIKEYDIWKIHCSNTFVIKPIIELHTSTLWYVWNHRGIPDTMKS